MIGIGIDISKNKSTVSAINDDSVKFGMKK